MQLVVPEEVKLIGTLSLVGLTTFTVVGEQVPPVRVGVVAYVAFPCRSMTSVSVCKGGIIVMSNTHS